MSLSEHANKTIEHLREEIAQYKTMWENAEDANMKLIVQVNKYREALEKLLKDIECYCDDLGNVCAVHQAKEAITRSEK